MLRGISALKNAALVAQTVTATTAGRIIQADKRLSTSNQIACRSLSGTTAASAANYCSCYSSVAMASSRRHCSSLGQSAAGMNPTNASVKSSNEEHGTTAENTSTASLDAEKKERAAVTSASPTTSNSDPASADKKDMSDREHDAQTHQAEGNSSATQDREEGKVDAAGADATPAAGPSDATKPTTPAVDPSLVPNEFGKVDPNAGPLKVKDDGEFEPMRWISQPYQDPALLPKVDEKGEYIVSKGDWPTGEMAYRPLPRTDVTPRFGYNIVSVKKPQTYWSYWRKNEHFNVTYVGIQGLFILGMAWLMGFLYDEIRAYETEGRSAGNHAGEVRGKGRTDRKKQKIEFSPEEQDVMLQNAQESYITGAESKFLGNRDYKMKKIARPEEYNYEEFRKR